MGNFALKTAYDDLIKQLKEKYGFETTGWDEKRRCIKFTRTVDDRILHTVRLQDDRDDKNIRDWLIFSFINDDPNDWALELNEYRLFDDLIQVLEDLYPLIVLEKKGEE